METLKIRKNFLLDNKIVDEDFKSMKMVHHEDIS